MMLRKLAIFGLLLAATFGIQAAAPATSHDQPPLPPIPPSPVQQFRSWLDMPEAERDKALAEWPVEKQKILREKLAFYQGLPASQRDRRLNMLELRWYLRPLMRLPPDQRAATLQSVPAPIQPMVMERLDAWDKLGAQTRAELLDNEETHELVMAHFAQIRRGVPQNEILGALDEPRRLRLQSALDTWNHAQTSSERRQRATQLAQFFEMPRAEQSKTLSGLSPAEQAEIQRTLDAFAQLAPQQRRACVNSFQKFATMTPEERGSFLRNAARWQAMTPQERQTWKQLVTKLPPMPPEPVAFPPIPQVSNPARNLATTNTVTH
jgi:hypothetical protein